MSTSHHASALIQAPGFFHRTVLHALLWLASIPVFLIGLIISPFGKKTILSAQSLNGHSFSVPIWKWPGTIGQWLSRSPFAHWSALLLVWNGTLTWIGPLPIFSSTSDSKLPSNESDRKLNSSDQIAHLTPGLISPWSLMKRHLPACDQRDVEFSYFMHRSLDGDLSLIFNSIRHLFLRSSAFNFPDKVIFDTLRVDNFSLRQSVSLLSDYLAEAAVGGETKIISFVNVHIVNLARRKMKIRRAYNASHLVLPEGFFLYNAARLLRNRLRTVSGRYSFLHEALTLASGQDMSVFVLAADDHAACAQAIRLRYPSLRIVGSASTQDTSDDDGHWSLAIQNTNASLVLLSMPDPDAVVWLAEQHTYLGPWVVVCPGPLSTSTDLSTSLLPTAPTVGFWGLQKFYLAVLLQRWLGGVTPEAPQLRLQSAGDAVIPRRAYVMALTANHDALLQDLAVVPALIPVGSQSLLAMHMEQMAHVGCKQIELLTDADPIRFREILNEGERWGLSLTLHLASDATDAFKRLQIMLRMEAKRGSASLPVWLVDASCWVPDLVQLPDPDHPSHGVWLSQASNGAHAEVWAGYAKLSLGMLSQLCALTRWEDIGIRLAEAAAHQPTSPQADGVPFHRIHTRSTHLQTFTGLVAAADMAKMGVLDQPNWIRLPQNERIQGEVWMAKTAVVDELAHCQGPVFIGPYSVVSANAKIGPNVVLGAHVKVEDGVEIKHSIVLPGITIGQGLDITQSLVGLSGIASLTWHSFVPSQALGHLLKPTHSIIRKVGWSERIVVLALLPLLPVLSLLPGSRAESPLGTAFRTRFRPGLLKVLWGGYALVGRSSETEALVATEWRDLAADPLGVIAVGDTWGANSVDEHLMADLYWSVNQSWPERWTILRSYLRALATGKTVSLTGEAA